MGYKFGNMTLTPFAGEAITVASNAIGFTAATIISTEVEPAKKAVVTLETAQIRFRVDGTNPEATVGHLLGVGDTLILEGEDEIRLFRGIRTSATSASIHCTYYK